MRAARAAIDATGEKVLLTARSEAILRQAGGLPEALRRLAAYAEAGADVLYAPLVRTSEEVAEVEDAKRPSEGVDASSMESIKVFISYSHDSPVHKEKVGAFAKKLRADGIDATIDSHFSISPYYGYAAGKSVIQAIYPKGKDGHLAFLELNYRF